MPLFDYRCSACDARFEQLVRDDTRVTCPSCRSGRVTRLLSVPAPPATATAGSAPPGPCGAPIGPADGCCGGGCGLN